MERIGFRITLLLSLIGLSVGCAPKPMPIILPYIFDDGLVLQQGDTNIVRGWSNAMERIEFSWNGQRYKTRCDLQGVFTLRLPPVAAGGPYKLEIISPTDTAVIDSIWSGDVFLASGQSNMAISLSQNANPNEPALKDPTSYPVHFFTIDERAKLNPLENPYGKWASDSPRNRKSFSAVAYYFAKELSKQKKIPIGVYTLAFGGAPVESFIPEWALEDDYTFGADVAKNRALRSNKVPRSGSLERGAYSLIRRLGLMRAPFSININRKSPYVYTIYDVGVYFNCGIHALRDTKLKGVLWYQGEENYKKAAQYVRLFPKLVNSWRAYLSQDSLPFLFVQLSGLGSKNGDCSESLWAEMREIQAKGLELPNTGMALAYDVGDEKDIHPKDKASVGLRLFSQAEAVIYQRKSGRYPTSPNYKVLQHLDFLELRFQEPVFVKGGAELGGFCLAGLDGRFQTAKAEQPNPLTIRVSGVSMPYFLRYAWQNNPAEANLYYREDSLPVQPFRTDRLRYLTFGLER